MSDVPAHRDGVAPGLGGPASDGPRQRGHMSRIGQGIARSARAWRRRDLLSLALSAAIAMACRWASGVSLGLFFGPFLLLAFVAPILAIEESAARRLCATASITAGVGIVWMFAPLPMGELLRCGLVLFSFILAMNGLVALLKAAALGVTGAATATAIITFAWLAWPVWLCPWLNGPHAEVVARWLVVAHPLMAINGVVFDQFNIWDRYTLAYQQLTTLNQDVLYTLPRTIVPAVALHGSIGAASLLGGKTAGEAGGASGPLPSVDEDEPHVNPRGSSR